MTLKTGRVLLACLALAGAASPAAAQAVETAGVRALGMGGAFTALASDSSATWWNPAGIAAGPFLDLSLTRTALASDDLAPARREGLSSFALTTLPLGVAFYRFRITDIR